MLRARVIIDIANRRSYTGSIATTILAVSPHGAGPPPGAVDSGPMMVWPALAATAAVLLLCLPRAALTLDNGVSLTPDMGW